MSENQKTMWRVVAALCWEKSFDTRKGGKGYFNHGGQKGGKFLDLKEKGKIRLNRIKRRQIKDATRNGGKKTKTKGGRQCLPGDSSKP